MKTTLFALGLTLASFAFNAVAAERTVTLAIDNMSCVTCPITVKAAIKRVPGVRAVQVDYKTKQATVTFDDTRTSAKALAKASTDVGFPGRVE
jgi:mercuric ion binding protein